jgi:phage terminase small subunit
MLTVKQQRFVEAYAANPNGARAAIRAGYSARTARVIASENLRKPEIAAAIKKATERRQALTNVLFEQVQDELSKIAFANASGIFDENRQIRALSEWPDALMGVVNYRKTERVRRNRNGDETARVVTLKVDVHGKLKALKMLAEILGFFSRRSTKRRPTRA